MLLIAKTFISFFSTIPNIALALAVVIIIFQAVAIKKLYSRIEKIYDQQTEVLKMLVPWVIGSKK